MNRICIFFILFSFVGFTSLQAQLRIGAKAGGNMSDISIEMSDVVLEYYEPRVGYHVGFMAECMLSPHFGFQTDLVYYYSGANVNNKERLGLTFNKDGSYVDDITVDGHLGMGSLHWPLYLKTKFELTNNVQMYLMGGGFVTYALGADHHITLSSGGKSVQLKWGLYEEAVHMLDQRMDNVYRQKKFNGGIVFEGGVEVNSRLTIGFSFRQILSNMSDYSIVGDLQVLKQTVKMSTVSLSAGYYF